jgi:hypothetical protein
VLRARHSVGALAVSVCALSLANDGNTKKPHELPTYSGDKPSYHAPEKPPKPGQLPDARELYEKTLNCWPVPSFMRAEVTLEGRARSDRTQVMEEDGSVRTAGRLGVALVARLPLYSALELDREREREYMRRTKLADATGNFISILAERQKHVRQLELLRALERRAQERVKAGITETSEQVGYLEKVAAVEGELLKQSGMLQKARLELIGHCSTLQADEVDRYILQYMPKAGR